MSKMSNLEYIDSLGNLTTEQSLAISVAMDKYGDNKWWLSDDLKTIGYYQLNEDFMLVDFSKFHQGVENLLGRSVWIHEFGLNIDALRKDAENAWNGLIKTKEEITDDIKNGIDTLLKIDKPIIIAKV